MRLRRGFERSLNFKTGEFCDVVIRVIADEALWETDLPPVCLTPGRREIQAHRPRTESRYVATIADSECLSGGD
jgi:hypothetical protein